MKFSRFVRFFGLALVILAGATMHGSAQEVKSGAKLDIVSDNVKSIDKDAKETVSPPLAKEATARAKRDLEALKKSLQTLRRGVTAPEATVESLVGFRDKLVALRTEIVRAKGKLDTPTRDIGAQLAELGPAPKKGESEVAAIAAKRKLLTQTVGNLTAAQKQFDLLDVEAGQLAALTSKLQREAFAKRVFVARKSVLNPRLWTEFVPTIGDFYLRTSSVFKSWIDSKAQNAVFSGYTSLLVVISLFAAAVLGFFGIWQKMSNPPGGLRATNNLRRIWRAVGGIFLVGVVNLALVSASVAVLNWSGVEDLRVERLVLLACRVLFIISVSITILRAVVSPVNADWRLADLSDPSAKRIYHLGVSLILVLGIGWLLSGLAAITFLPIEFTVGSNALVSMMIVALIAVKLSTARRSNRMARNVEDDPSRLFYFGWTANLYLPFWLLLVISVCSLLFGYIALAYFITTNFVLTAGLVVGLYLIHHLVDALVDTSTQPWSRIGKLVRNQVGLGDNTISRIGLLFSTITDVSVVILGISLILGLWAITWIDLSALTTQAFNGFKVGDIYIEPDSILLGIGIFVVGVIIVRLFSYWIERRILGRSRIDAGVQNSIATAAKYTGLFLAAGFALSAAGLDFSKLAIVAGALSVGIGFGLQSVVSNFVSGLILLAERPIRIGDWIEVGSGEGTVKKINVRSTEIETFDRCKVIIPNSSFISDPVKNWSHGSSVGRIKVNVGVGYDSDPEQVRKILLDCANAHAEVVSSPAPRVIFMDFGASSLDFQLRVFLRDIGDCTTVASDLRFAIFRAFADAGIEIPFPQNDIHIRDVDQIAETFNAVKSPKPSRKGS